MVNSFTFTVVMVEQGVECMVNRSTFTVVLVEQGVGCMVNTPLSLSPMSATSEQSRGAVNSTCKIFVLDYLYLMLGKLIFKYSVLGQKQIFFFIPCLIPKNLFIFNCSPCFSSVI